MFVLSYTPKIIFISHNKNCFTIVLITKIMMNLMYWYNCIYCSLLRIGRLAMYTQDVPGATSQTRPYDVHVYYM